jgi:hypothetical protein
MMAYYIYIMPLFSIFCVSQIEKSKEKSNKWIFYNYPVIHPLSINKRI